MVKNYSWCFQHYQIILLKMCTIGIFSRASCLIKVGKKVLQRAMIRCWNDYDILTSKTVLHWHICTLLNKYLNFLKYENVSVVSNFLFLLNFESFKSIDYTPKIFLIKAYSISVLLHYVYSNATKWKFS